MPEGRNYVLLNARRARFAAIVVFLLLLILKTPAAFFAPSMLEDDGFVFLNYSISHRGIAGIWNTSNGYLMLVASLPSTLAVELLPLEFAAYFFNVILLFIYGVLAYVIVATDSPFVTWRSKLLALACVLLCPKLTYWKLCSAHFYLGLLAILIYVSPRSDKPFYNALLLFSGLSAPIAIFLTPLFVWDGLKDKTKRRPALTLCLACLVQFVAELNSGMGSLTVRMAGNQHLAVLIAWLLNLTYSFSFFGLDEYINNGYELTKVLRSAEVNSLYVLPAAVLLGIGAKLMDGIEQHEARQATRRLVLCYFLVAILSFLTARSDRMVMLTAHSRYLIVPATILYWALVMNWSSSRLLINKVLYGIAVLWIMAVGVLHYQVPNDVRRASWVEEVTKWRRNPYYMPNGGRGPIRLDRLSPATH